MEIWKDIPMYKDIYQVSDLGNVKRLGIIGCFGNEINERLLKKTKLSTGYLGVDLSKDGKRKQFCIHQLVAFAFLNHNSQGCKLVVNHIDFDKTNNNINNLEVITHRSNLSHREKKGTSKYTGVSWYKKLNKWQSAIQINGKVKYLGYFKTEIEASNVYQNELLKLKYS